MKAADCMAVLKALGEMNRLRDGLDAWLDAVTTQSEPGRRIAEVDYDIYAEGEAVLGWLNATFMLCGEQTEWNLPTHRYDHVIASQDP